LVERYSRGNVRLAGCASTKGFEYLVIGWGCLLREGKIGTTSSTDCIDGSLRKIREVGFEPGRTERYSDSEKAPQSHIAVGEDAEEEEQKGELGEAETPEVYHLADVESLASSQ
jgi:hypothetical protein